MIQFPSLSRSTFPEARRYKMFMEGPTSEKLQKLFAMLEREPRDPFLLYGIGMEYKKLGAADKSLEFFTRTIELDPSYCYAYFQRGQVFEQSAQIDAARQSYEAGIAAARKAGDAHAQGELQAALDMIADG
jgi:tetratricopeptide (TPR) repeat protein